MNHNYFAGILTVLAVALAFFAQQLTGQNLEILAIKLVNVALLTGTSLAFIKFTKGTKFDVLKEIFEEHNISAAIYIGLFVLALALAITVNS